MKGKRGCCKLRNVRQQAEVVDEERISDPQSYTMWGGELPKTLKPWQSSLARATLKTVETCCSRPTCWTLSPQCPRTPGWEHKVRVGEATHKNFKAPPTLPSLSINEDGVNVTRFMRSNRHVREVMQLPLCVRHVQSLLAYNTRLSASREWAYC